MAQHAYWVTGTDRQLNAIGIMEPWSMRVQADDYEEAQECARQSRYAEGREHVLVKHCERIA